MRDFTLGKRHIEYVCEYTRQVVGTQKEINASSYTADSGGKLPLCIPPRGSYLICHVGTLSSAHFGVVDIKL